MADFNIDRLRRLSQPLRVRDCLMFIVTMCISGHRNLGRGRRNGSCQVNRSFHLSLPVTSGGKDQSYSPGEPTEPK